MSTTTTRLVWRMEDARGNGAFEATPLGLWEARYPGGTWAYMRDHPLPYDDGLPRPEFDVRFGCRDCDQLRHWFPPFMVDVFPDYGLDLTVWRVPAEDVLDGGHQVAFKPDHAECIERRPATDLYSATLPLAA